MLSRSRRRPGNCGLRTRKSEAHDMQGLAGLKGRSMSGTTPRLLICSCEKSMPLDAQAIGRACSAHVTQANQLCGADLAQFKAALAEGAEITIACTQEAPLFKEVAEDLQRES